MQGKTLSNDLQWTLLHMVRTLDTSLISRITGVGYRTIQRLLMDYRKKGTVDCERQLRRGRRSLSGAHVQVCFRCYLAVLGTQKQCSVCKDFFNFVPISFSMSWRCSWVSGLVQMLVSPQYGGHFINQDLHWRRWVLHASGGCWSLIFTL